MTPGGVPTSQDPARDDPHQIRLRHFYPMMLVTLGVNVINVSLDLYLGLYKLLVLSLLVTVTATFSILVLRLFRNYTLASWALGLCFVLFHPMNIYASGGINSPMLVWIFTVTAVISYFYEPRQIIGLLVPYYVLILMVFYAGHKGPVAYGEASPIINAAGFRLFHFVAAAGTTMIMFRIYNNMIRTLDQRKTRLLHEKKNLIAILCHDITNPAMATDFLAGRALDPRIEQGELLERIKKSNRTILDIVKSVRDLEALGGQQSIRREAVDLDEVLVHLRLVFKAQLEKKSIAIEYHSEAQEKILVSANRSLLANNVMGNLISNSIKFSNHDSVIQVEAKRVDGDVEISIKDQGIGMPRELVDTLFESDFTRSRMGTDGERGTGFGAGVVRTSMELMGGKVSVQSKDMNEFPDDHGTEFKLLLPAAE